MKILWVSNAPTANTGYGTQSRLFCPRIRDLGHEVEILAFYGQEGCISLYQDMRVWPRAHRPYGKDVLMELVERKGALGFDCVITLIDAWVMPGRELTSKIHWAPWFPSDTEQLAEAVYEQVRFANTPMVFSRHAERQCIDMGLSPVYVPHGFDSSIFFPDAEKREQTRREVLGVPDDCFLISIIAANKGRDCRKSWFEHLDALETLMGDYRHVYLYLHTNLSTQNNGVPIEMISKTLGIPADRVKACDQFKNSVGGYSDEEMAGFYNASDLLLNVAHGEGFGLPVMEAMACGTRVLVGEWTAMGELAEIGECTTVSREDTNRIVSDIGGTQRSPHSDAILQRLVEEVEAPPADEAERASRAERIFGHFDADLVAKRYWAPALESIEENLSRAPSVEITPPIAPHE